MPEVDRLRIAERCARVTGDEHTLSALMTHSLAATYDLMRVRGAVDAIALEVRHRGDDSLYASTLIAHYNPAVQRWGFAPEYASRREGEEIVRETVNTAVIQEVNMAARAAGEEVVDVLDERTHRVRRALALQMRSLYPKNMLRRPEVHTALSEDGPDPTEVIGMDDHTFCYPVIAKADVTKGEKMIHVRRTAEVSLSIATEYDLDTPGHALLLCCRGLIVRHPRHPGTVRDMRYLAVAARHPEINNNVWTHIPGIITERESGILMPLASLIEAEAVLDPDFSMARCAVAYNTSQLAI